MVEYDKGLEFSNDMFERIIKAPNEFDINRIPHASRDELLQFSKLAYDEELVNEKLPPGWELLTTAKNKLNDYSGLAVWNSIMCHVVIAHRGTVVGWHPGTLWADLAGVYFNKCTSHVNSATTFVEVIANVLREKNTCSKTRALQMSITGHSLGGWLAAVTTLTAEYLQFNGQEFVRRDSGLHPHTIAFDCPGSKEMILKIRREYDFSVSPTMLLRELDITVYIIQENPVNMTNEQVGEIHVTIINGETLDLVNNTLFSIRNHSLNNFAFHSVHKEYVLDWLKSPGEIDLGLAYWVNGKCFTEYRGNSSTYRVFSMEEIKFLRIFSSLKASATIVKSNQFTFLESLFSKNAILKEYNIECSTKEELEIFIRAVKQIVRWFYSQVMAELDGALQVVPGAFYRHLSQASLHAIPTILLNCRDSLEVSFFLDSDKLILCLEVEDIPFQIARLRNILVQRKQLSRIIDFESLLIISSIVNIIDLYNKEEFMNENLLIINCCNLNTCTQNFESFKQVIKCIQNSNHILKVIIFHSIESQLPSLIKDCGLFGIKKIDCFDVTDLTKLSIKNIFERKIIVHGDRMLSFNDIHVRSPDELQKLIGCNLKYLLTDDSFNISIKSLPVNLTDFETLISRVKVNVQETSLVRLVQSNPRVRIVVSGKGRMAETSPQIVEGSHELFRQECCHHHYGALYWLKANSNVSRLTLREVHAPWFYLERQFHLKYKIVIEGLVKNRLIDDVFIIDDFEGDDELLFYILGLSEETKELFRENLNYFIGSGFKNDQCFKNIHHLALETPNFEGQLIWKKSEGSLETLRSAVTPDQNQWVEEGSLGQIGRRVVIIADEPGMGKSRSLATIYRLAAPDQWPILLELRNLQEEIRNLPMTFDIDSAVSFLLVRHSTADSLEHRLLQHCLQDCSPIKVLVLLDGFDEIKYQGAGDPGRRRVLEFIRFLVVNSSANVIVTTRLFPKNYLENELLQFATVFKKIDKAVQINYLINYWRTHLELVLPNFGEQEEEILNSVTRQLYEACEGALGLDFVQLIGVPLLMRMLADIYLKPIFKFWCMETSFLKQKFILKSAYDLYSKFIENKFHICFNEKMKMILEKRYLNIIKRKIMKNHQSLSISTLNIDNPEQYVKIITPTNHEGWSTLLDISRYGLILVSEDGHFSFIHRTFAEFFCANFVTDWMTKEYNKCQNIHLTGLILQEILCWPQFRVTRKFINEYLTEFGMSVKAYRFMGEKVLDYLKNSDVKTVVSYNKNPLHVAVDEGNTEIFSLFMNKSNISLHQNHEYFSFVSTTNTDQITALYLAHAKAGFEEKVLDFIDNCPPELKMKYLLAAFMGAHLYIYDRESVNTAFMQNELFLEGNISQTTVLAYQTIEELLDSTVDLLTTLIESGDRNEIEGLYQSLQTEEERHYIPLSLNRNGDTGINIAVERGELDLVKLFCNDDVLKSIDVNGNTALHLAVKSGCLEIVRFLVENKSNIESANKKLQTPLLIAIINGHTDIVRYLVNNKSDIHLVHKKHGTALHLAVRLNDLKTVNLLLEQGAHIDAYDSVGFTPLMTAVDASNYDMVLLLLNLNCDVTLVNYDGKTALELAEKNEYVSQDIVDALLNYNCFEIE